MTIRRWAYLIGILVVCAIAGGGWIYSRKCHGVDACAANEGAGEDFHAGRIFRGQRDRRLRESCAWTGPRVSRREAALSERAAEVAVDGDAVEPADDTARRNRR